MSEQNFNEAKSALAFSQSLRDRLNQPEEPVEEPMMEEPAQEENIETNPMEEKLEVIDQKLDTLLEVEKEETEEKEAMPAETQVSSPEEE